MAKYLGETVIDVKNHPVLSLNTPADWAMYYIGQYGGIEGDHHRAWVLDQVARILNGTPVTAREARWDNGEVNLRVITGEPSAGYLAWSEEMKGEVGQDGEHEYTYDVGIPP